MARFSSPLPFTGATNRRSLMLDFSTRLGRHVNRRLRQEKIIWLTIVDSENTPQPRPVWFHWDGENILIFSQQSKAKLRQHKSQPSSFFELRMRTAATSPSSSARLGLRMRHPIRAGLKPYLRKYREGHQGIGNDCRGVFQLIQCADYRHPAEHARVCRVGWASVYRSRGEPGKPSQ
jgi:PPOX class probable F420-dependent enzyme